MQCSLSTLTTHENFFGLPLHTEIQDQKSTVEVEGDDLNLIDSNCNEKNIIKHYDEAQNISNDDSPVEIAHLKPKSGTGIISNYFKFFLYNEF